MNHLYYYVLLYLDPELNRLDYDFNQKQTMKSID